MQRRGSPMSNNKSRLIIGYGLDLLGALAFFIVLNGRVHIYLSLAFLAICVIPSYFMCVKAYESEEKKIKVLAGLNFVLNTLLSVFGTLILAAAQFSS